MWRREKTKNMNAQNVITADGLAIQLTSVIIFMDFLQINEIEKKIQNQVPIKHPHLLQIVKNQVVIHLFRSNASKFLSS